MVMEATYGNRYHKKDVNHVDSLARIIQETLDRQGNVVIPAFAVGRTQELLYLIRHIKEERLVTGHDSFEVYVDSLWPWKPPMCLRTICWSAMTGRQKLW